MAAQGRRCHAPLAMSAAQVTADAAQLDAGELLWQAIEPIGDGGFGGRRAGPDRREKPWKAGMSDRRS